MHNTRKIIERLLIFFIGIPVVFAIIFLLPYYNYLTWNIAAIVFSAIGALELSQMLNKKNINVSKPEAFILGSIAPICATLTVSFNLPGRIVPVILMTGALWVLLSKLFSKTDMDTVITRLAGGFSLMAYPGIFMYWLIKISEWNSASIIFLFMIIVFFNDSFAWLTGSLFGKNNKGLIPASPNKSIAGFIGGMLGSVLISIGALYFFPGTFIIDNPLTSDILTVGIILGFLTGIFATLGDLAESAIKRSCDFKDSGNVILGRGGILDSVDSIVAAAPVFYFIYSYFFNI